MTEALYPKRPQFFSQKFHRLMTKVTMAQDYGTLGYAFLSVIVCQEDACRYRKPVSFWDGQLMPLLGINSRSTITSIRRKLIDGGWLYFSPGTKGRASRYWVLVPLEHSEVNDAPVEEGSDEVICPINGQKADINATESQPNPDRIRSVTILSPIPIPGAQPDFENLTDQVKPRVLAESFIFHWTEKARFGRTPRSAIELEPQFAEHLRRHPKNFDCIKVEIESPNRDRNEWPDKLLKRFEVVKNGFRPLPPLHIPDAGDVFARAEADFRAAKQAEDAKKGVTHE